MTPSLSICIPFFGDVSHLVVAVRTARAASTADCDISIFPDGQEASALLEEVDLPGDVVVAPTDQRLGLVANWNRCLAMSDGALVHILHGDDAVAPDFYRAIFALVNSFPEASVYVVGCRPFDSHALEVPVVPPSFQLGGEALKALLSGSHCAGSVAVTRKAVVDKGPFRAEFDYCPDEEAFLRYAAVGGLALDPRPLYLERSHCRQARLATWLRADFAEQYMEARVAGASCFGNANLRAARESSAHRIVSAAISLGIAGKPAAGRSLLGKLWFRNGLPVGVRIRVAAGWISLAVPPLLHLLKRRRDR